MTLAACLPPPYRFGTSGYRANTQEAFNPVVVQRITQSIIDYLLSEYKPDSCPVILLGGDTREKTAMALPVVAYTLLRAGFCVLQTAQPVTTPVLAYACTQYKAWAVLLTASHNPWDYGGYNLLTPHGAVAPNTVGEALARLQCEPLNLSYQKLSCSKPQEASLRLFDPLEAYLQHITHNIQLDFSAIKASKMTVVYDGMNATGESVMRPLLDCAGVQYQCIQDLSERMPEPKAQYLEQLCQHVRAQAKNQALKNQALVVGLANDGDADRFGVVDEAGVVLSPNDVLLLVLYHLLTHRKDWLRAQGFQKHICLVRSQATTHLLDVWLAKLAQSTSFEYSVVETPVGYKYIAECFLEPERYTGGVPVLLGGESSGGLSIGGHIPEKDGLLANGLVLELMAKEGCGVGALLARLKQQFKLTSENTLIFAEHSFRSAHAAQWLSELAHNPLLLEAQAAGRSIDLSKTMAHRQHFDTYFGMQDGVKVFFEGGAWLLVRASGTEPLVRLYTEWPADDLDRFLHALQAVF